MVTEKELIGKLQELRQIKPGKDWAISTKTQILGETPGFSFFPYFKPALAGLVSVFIFFGVFAFSQNSVPGDSLYSVKKIVERGQAVFVSEQEKPQASLELANKRLEELTKIAETNQAKKLAPAITELQASVSEAAKSLSKMEGTSSDPVAIKKLVDGAKELGESKRELEASQSVVLGGEEFDELKEVSGRLEVELYKLVVQNLISDLEKSSLTEEKEEVLNQMRGLAKEGRYLEALELLPLINE